MLVASRAPEAATTYFAVIWSPRSVDICQWLVRSSNRIRFTRAPNRIISRNPNRSATWLAYASRSACGEKYSGHRHSCCRSSSNEYEYCMLSMSTRAPG